MFVDLFDLEIWHSLTLFYVGIVVAQVGIVLLSSLRRFYLRHVLSKVLSDKNKYEINTTPGYLVRISEQYAYDRGGALRSLLSNFENNSSGEFVQLNEFERDKLKAAYLDDVRSIAKRYDQKVWQDHLPDKVFYRLLSSAASEYFNDFAEDYQKLFARTHRTVRR